MNSLIETSVHRLQNAIREHKPSHVFALYSGGHDSRCAVEVACRVKEFSGCVHCNTGIGVEETREHVRETCKEKGFRLLEYKATENTRADGTPDPQDYDALVRSYGFPGPGHHTKMYNRLKERSLRRLMRQFKVEHKDRIMLVSGCRSAESTRRMGNVEEVQRSGCQVWCAPIHDWASCHKEQVMRECAIKPNPVVECLGMSGECLCGAFAEAGEQDRVATYFPYIDERLNRLHAEIKHKFPWRWDEQPPKKTKRQKEIESGQVEIPFMPLCWNCNKNHKLLPAATA